MIVIAKAQGLNRVIQFNPQLIKIKTPECKTTVRWLTNNFIKLIELSMSHIKYHIYFLQFRLILNKTLMKTHVYRHLCSHYINI